jgi:cell division protein FtsB
MRTPIARAAFAIVLLSVCAFAFVTLTGPNGLRALFEKQTQIREAEKRNGALAKEIERKREHIKRLDQSPAEQELEIRDRLKLVHPNDKVYVTGEPEKTTPPKR